MGWTNPPTEGQLTALREIFPCQTIAVKFNRGFPRDHYFIEIG